jgi:hypothetical protein
MKSLYLLYGVVSASALVTALSLYNESHDIETAAIDCLRLPVQVVNEQSQLECLKPVGERAQRLNAFVGAFRQ